MQGDVRTAYLFQCGTEGLFSVSLDKAGANIPRSSCTQGWLLRKEFQLDARDPVPATIGAESITRGINAKGYYTWRDPCWTQRNTFWLAARPSPLTSIGTTTETNT
jgi:hypothetical protein